MHLWLTARVLDESCFSAIQANLAEGVHHCILNGGGSRLLRLPF